MRSMNMNLKSQNKQYCIKKQFKRWIDLVDCEIIIAPNNINSYPVYSADSNINKSYWSCWAQFGQFNDFTQINLYDGPLWMVLIVEPSWLMFTLAVLFVCFKCAATSCMLISCCFNEFLFHRYMYVCINIWIHFTTKNRETRETLNA